MRIDFPGLFDLQVNGFAGIDFNASDLSADGAVEALEQMRTTGVTRCLPTLITSSFAQFAWCAGVLARLTHPMIAGLHMEGPYVSPEDGARGAHPRHHVAPASIDDYRRRQEAAGGRIRLVTLAPEVPGALRLIERLVADGVRVAIGHTAASSEQIADGVSAGASLSTHLGNGCAQLLPRHPNVIWDQLAEDGLYATFIVDGHHLPATTVKAMIQAKTPTRSMLISDAIAAAGGAPGAYTIGDVRCELGADGRVSLPGTTYLAGSSLTLDRAIGHTARFTGLPIEAILPMASTTPARFLGTTTAGTVSAEWNPDTCVLSVITVD